MSHVKHLEVRNPGHSQKFWSVTIFSEIGRHHHKLSFFINSCSSNIQGTEPLYLLFSLPKMFWPWMSARTGSFLSPQIKCYLLSEPWPSYLLIILAYPCHCYTQQCAGKCIRTSSRGQGEGEGLSVALYYFLGVNNLTTSNFNWPTCCHSCTIGKNCKETALTSYTNVSRRPIIDILNYIFFLLKNQYMKLFLYQFTLSVSVSASYTLSSRRSRAVAVYSSIFCDYQHG